MPNPIANGLNILANGLRPYVASRARLVLPATGDQKFGENPYAWDAQSLLLFMWEYWNELFRNELTYAERSLISELREYRNRWAHQDVFSNADEYRFLDNIERLLTAIHSDQIGAIRVLRRSALQQLWDSEIRSQKKTTLLQTLWPYLLCGASAVSLDAAIVTFGKSPWSWMLAGLVFLAMMRIAWKQAIRESMQRPGPHECSSCGCIIYTDDCPYCQQTESTLDTAHLLTPLSKSWKSFRLPGTPTATSASHPTLPTNDKSG